MILTRRLRGLLRHPRLPVGVALIALLLAAPALRGGFQFDDHFQRERLLGRGEPSLHLFVFANGDVDDNARGMEEGWLPWWTSPRFRHASLRYLSVLTMQLDYLLWPNQPAWMHAHSLLWLGALVALVAYFYRTILGATSAAGLAALLYAVDDAHARPAAYLANRNALIATFFGVLSVVCFSQRRERDEHFAWGSAASLALGLAAGELALSAAAYLAAYSLFLDRGSASGRVRALAPHGVVVVAWALAYRLGGFGATDSGFYREPTAAPLAYARTALGHIPVLIMGQWTPVPSDIASGVPPGGSAALTLCWIGVATIAVLVFLFATLVRRDRVARFFAFGACLSLAPIAATFPQDRLLFYVGLGSMGLLSRLAYAFLEEPALLPSSRWWRLPAGMVLVLLLAMHLVLAALAAPLSIAYEEAVSGKMLSAIASVPSEPALSAQDLILVNPPDFVYTAAAILPVKRLAGAPTPRRLRVLSASPTSMRITRVDARSLRVHLDDGLFNVPMTLYYRAPEVELAVGTRVILAGFSAEVAGSNATGNPDQVLFRFATPLEDPSLRWLEWRDGVYAPWRPPSIGETERLAAPKGIFE